MTVSPSPSSGVAEFVTVVGAIVSVLSALGALAAAVATWRKNRADVDKTDAEAKSLEDQITERVLKRANEELKKRDERIDELTVEVTAMRRENESLRLGVYALCKQIEALGHTPVYQPPVRSQ